jgi:DNA repair exonuclease SbcCD ATPase subunit
MSRVVTTCEDHAACVLVSENGVDKHVPGEPRVGDRAIRHSRTRKRESETLIARLEDRRQALASIDQEIREATNRNVGKLERARASLQREAETLSALYGEVLGKAVERKAEARAAAANVLRMATVALSDLKREMESFRQERVAAIKQAAAGRAHISVLLAADQETTESRLRSARQALYEDAAQLVRETEDKLSDLAVTRDRLREELNAIETSLKETIPHVKAEVERLKEAQEERMRLEEGRE